MTKIIAIIVVGFIRNLAILGTIIASLFLVAHFFHRPEMRIFAFEMIDLLLIIMPLYVLYLASLCIWTKKLTDQIHQKLGLEKEFIIEALLVLNVHSSFFTSAERLEQEIIRRQKS